MSRPQPFLEWVWPSISSSGCALRVHTGAGGGFMYSHRSTFPKPCGLSLFFISHSSRSPAPWRVCYLPLYLSKFCAVLSRAPFLNISASSTAPSMENVTSVQLWTCWEPWVNDIWWAYYVYLLPGPIMRAVLRRVATEWPCLWSMRVNEDGSTLLPSHPHSPYPDKGKPLSGSDSARHLWGLPLLHSFHFSFPSFYCVSLFHMPLSLSVWREIA